MAQISLLTSLPTGAPASIGAVWISSTQGEVVVDLADEGLQGAVTLALLKYGAGNKWRVTETFDCLPSAPGRSTTHVFSVPEPAYYHVLRISTLGTVDTLFLSSQTPATTIAKSMRRVAGEALTALLPVYIKAADGLAWLTTTAESTVAAMAGIVVADAILGADVDIYIPGQEIDLPAAVLGTELFAYNGALVAYGSVPAGAYFRSVGSPSATGKLNFVLGPVLKKKA